jgi:hypothetical protein
MLAGVRQIAYQLAMAMAGILVIALAHSIWVALFRADVDYFFHPFDFQLPMFWSPWEYEVGYLEGLMCLSVVTWLIGSVIRRSAKSMSPDRPA